MPNIYTFKTAFTLVLALCLATTSCHRNDILEGSKNVSNMELSSHVHLHRTSGKTVTVTDKDGFGLVYGNVTKITVVANNSNTVFLEFFPFNDEAQDKRHFAEINLADASVVLFEHIPASYAQHLKPIEDVLP